MTSNGWQWMGLPLMTCICCNLILIADHDTPIRAATVSYTHLNNFTAPQAVECSHDNAKLRRVTLNRFEKLLQFLSLIHI